MLERYHTGARRAGAGLDDTARKTPPRKLPSAFGHLGHHVQPERARRRAGVYTLSVDGEAELARLPDYSAREAMKSRRAGAQARRPRGHAVALQRRAVPAILKAPRPAEKSSRAFAMRGDNGGATDNKAIICRDGAGARRARPNCSDFPVSPITGSTTPWPRRRPRCSKSARHGVGAGAARRSTTATPCRRSSPRTTAISSSPPGTGRYYAEKLRQQLADFDEMTIQPYLNLDRMIEAAFYTAQRLFGRRFSPRPDVPVCSGIPTCGCGRCAIVTVRRKSACSSATISRGRRSTAAPGRLRCAIRKSLPATSARKSSMSGPSSKRRTA